ncbi:hypothetical protein [Brevibacterium jeotgali]|uniref:Uncharacterized protein n=1 Tax=Brevibacterium jeotgali TaxID=1262550 RepID=A0A2H1L909_9MICO|nr:hypothetical protein [Brevibacterium jeotgali]TWC03262.1 hypothetical protein FB108_1985 [Brevibacterium jeotgali]SMY13270.1 hypothetical protein BJEO58_02882 [Brevibacterium jeotgali]
MSKRTEEDMSIDARDEDVETWVGVGLPASCRHVSHLTRRA